MTMRIHVLNISGLSECKTKALRMMLPTKANPLLSGESNNRINNG